MKTITYTIATGNLLAYDEPTDEQVAQYRDALSEAIEAEYPGAELRIRTERFSGGGTPIRIASDDEGYDDRDDIETVERISNEVWETWCAALPHEATDEQIEALRTEAGQAGDLDMVAICDRALDGDNDARWQVREVLDAAAAMRD